jgi:hypothetical protein
VPRVASVHSLCSGGPWRRSSRLACGRGTHDPDMVISLYVYINGSREIVTN